MPPNMITIIALGLDEGPVLAYDDPRRCIGKRVRIDNGRSQHFASD